MPTGAGQPRTYSVSADITAGQAHLDQLTDAIEAEAAITTALESMGGSGDVLDIYFAAALSAPEITALDAVVLAHAPVVVSYAYQMWEANPAQQVTAETYQEAMARTAAPLAPGTYRLAWYLEGRMAATGPLNSNGEVEVRLDGSVKGSISIHREQWDGSSGWDRVIVQSGAQPVLSIHVRRDPAEGGNDTVEVRKLKLSYEAMA